MLISGLPFVQNLPIEVSLSIGTLDRLLEKDFLVRWGPILAPLITVFLSLFVREIFRYFRRPRLRILEIRPYKQGTSKYWRMKIKNFGKSTARRAQVDVQRKIAGSREDDIISLPMRWTHYNKMTRPIARNQAVDLDVIEERRPEEGLYEVELIPVRGREVKDFVKLEFGKTLLELFFFMEFGKDVLVEIEITRREPFFFNAEIVKVDGIPFHIYQRKWKF